MRKGIKEQNARVSRQALLKTYQVGRVQLQIGNHQGMVFKNCRRKTCMGIRSALRMHVHGSGPSYNVDGFAIKPGMDLQPLLEEGYSVHAYSNVHLDSRFWSGVIPRSCWDLRGCQSVRFSLPRRLCLPVSNFANTNGEKRWSITLQGVGRSRTCIGKKKKAEVERTRRRG